MSGWSSMRTAALVHDGDDEEPVVLEATYTLDDVRDVSPSCTPVINTPGS